MAIELFEQLRPTIFVACLFVVVVLGARYIAKVAWILLLFMSSLRSFRRQFVKEKLKELHVLSDEFMRRKVVCCQSSQL